MRWIDELGEHRGERCEVAVVGCGARGSVSVGVHPDPIDVVPGVVGELGEEGTLGTAVAFAERVQGVDVGEEVRELANELVAVQPAQLIGCCQPAEDIPSSCLQVLRQAEQRPFRDRYRPQLAGPGEDVAEDVAVECPQVVQVVSAGQPPPFQVDQP